MIRAALLIMASAWLACAGARPVDVAPFPECSPGFACGTNHAGTCEMFAGNWRCNHE